MQIKDAGFWTRGTATLPPSPHITPETLIQDLQQAWGPRGYEVYKTALIGADVVLKKSGWTGIAIKILHSPNGTTLRFNPFAPSTSRPSRESRAARSVKRSCWIVVKTKTCCPVAWRATRGGRRSRVRWKCWRRATGGCSRSISDSRVVAR